MLRLQRLFMAALLSAGLYQSVHADTIYVTNTNDSGAGSLRQAITDANANASLTTILINIPGPLGSERIINVPTALPAFTAPVELRIDGTQTGKAVLKAPIINGPGAATTGLTFSSGSANSKVEFITFRDFVFSMVLNTGAITINNNHFENNQGGIDIRPVGSGGNTITGNVFTTSNSSASAFAGVSAGNTIKGNSFTGMGINLGAGGNIIGGPGNADPNTFSNITGTAIHLENASGSIVQHNTINGCSGDAITATGVDMQFLSNNFSNNFGWDLIVTGGFFNRIGYNQVMGDNGIFNGIKVSNGLSYSLYNNSLSGANFEIDSMTSSSFYGPLTITNNTVVNSPQGVSGYGAIALFGTTNAQIIGNDIHNNASNGVYLYGSTHNTIIGNTIYENFRAGVNVSNSLYNKISRNVIQHNHADVYGGRTGIALTPKTAPVITSAKRVGNNFVITGTGTVSNDSIEIFFSDRDSRNATLVQNALAFLGSVKSNGSSWTATLSAANYNSTEMYVMATTTDYNNTTSTFSPAIGVEINGPTSATTNHTATYFAEYIPGASYSWWSTLSISSQSSNGNQASFNFNQVGSGTVWVGYSDPNTGLWKQYSLAVTVFGPAREENDQAGVVQSLAFPNPFVSSTHVTVEGTEDITLQLFDSNGKMVYRSEGNTHGSTVELGAELAPGIYTLHVVSGSSVKTGRIVKMQ